MKNNQAIYSILVMLTFWCLWNTVKINNVKSDVENVDRIINRLSSEYQKEEEEKATSHRMSDEYEKTYFPQVFAQYRSMYGAGYTFEWNGKTYTTDYAEEKTSYLNGWVLNSDDYDDYCKSNYHDTCGICDGNGKTKWFADRDGDGLGDSTTFITSCDEPLASR